MNEKEEAAKNWEMIVQRKSLREKVARLENELDKFTREWSLASRINDGNNFKSDRYEANGDTLTIRHFSIIQSNYKTGLQIDLKAFDRGAIIALLNDLSSTRDELDKVSTQLRDLGE